RQPGADDHAEIPSAAAARVALLAAAFVLDDHRNVEPHERTHVGGENAVGRADQHELEHARDASDDLDHARIELPAVAIELREQLDLFHVFERWQGIDRGIERVTAHAARDFHSTLAAASRDPARRLRRVEERRDVELVGIGEARLLADDRAHADALIDAENAFLDDAVLDGPALVARRLKVEVPVIEPMRHQLAERAIDDGEVEPGGLEQLSLDDGKGIRGQIDARERGRNHRLRLNHG